MAVSFEKNTKNAEEGLEMGPMGQKIERIEEERGGGEEKGETEVEREEEQEEERDEEQKDERDEEQEEQVEKEESEEEDATAP